MTLSHPAPAVIKIRPLLATLVCACALATDNANAEGKMSVSLGADYSSGNYGGTQATEVWYFPLTAKYESDAWALRLTAPYLRITGPGNVLGTPGQIIVIPGAAVVRRTEAGMGDVVAGATWKAHFDPGAAYGIDLTGKIKFATADETRGLGTGKNDYALQADMFKSFSHSPASVFATLGYRALGEPAGVNLNNIWFGSLGCGYRFSATASAGAALDLRQASSAAGAPARELSAFVSYKLLPESKIQLYVLKGTTRSSPDWGGGMVYSKGF